MLGKKSEDLVESAELPQGFLKPKEILELTPHQLQDLLVSLEKDNRLEDFFHYACEYDALAAQLSYWEKWFRASAKKMIDDIVEKKKEMYGGGRESLPLALDAKFSKDELSLIFSNIGAIQLTFGCSFGCPFCGFDAVKGVREHISYPQLANLFQKFGPCMRISAPFLYWASDSADYSDVIEDKTYADVHQLAINYAGYQPYVTSFGEKDKKLAEFLSKIGTFELFGAHHRFSVYDLPVQDAEILGKQFPGVFQVGKGESHERGIGVSMPRKGEKAESEGGIGCFNGMLLTPRGLYNIYQTDISESQPQGQIVVPFESFHEGEPKSGVPLWRHFQHYAILNSYFFNPTRKPAVFAKTRDDLYIATLIDKNGEMYDTFSRVDARGEYIVERVEYSPLNTPLAREIYQALNEATGKGISEFSSVIKTVVYDLVGLCRTLYDAIPSGAMRHKLENNRHIAPEKFFAAIEFNVDYCNGEYSYLITQVLGWSRHLIGFFDDIPLEHDKRQQLNDLAVTADELRGLSGKIRRDIQKLLWTLQKIYLSDRTSKE